MRDNPASALAAITSPGMLTLGKVAMLCRIDSPIMAGKYDDLNETLAAIYIIEHPLSDSVENAGRIRDAAVICYDGLSPEEYRLKVARALDEVAAFFEMLPRPSPGSKKNSGTDGAPNSANGSAEPTTTESTGSSNAFRRSRRPSSGGAGTRGQAEARPARS